MVTKNQTFKISHFIFSLLPNCYSVVKDRSEFICPISQSQYHNKKGWINKLMLERKKIKYLGMYPDKWRNGFCFLSNCCDNCTKLFCSILENAVQTNNNSFTYIALGLWGQRSTGNCLLCGLIWQTFDPHFAGI